MTAVAYWYRNAFANMLGGASGANTRQSDYLSDTFKVALLSSSYSLNLDTHQSYTDLTNEVTGTGYSSGGATVASKTITETVANSWSPTWAAGTSYTVGDVVRPTSGNGYLYVCTTTGSSHASTEPTWPTVLYDEVTDNTTKWCCIGKAITVVDAADPSWGAAATISGIRYAVLYNNTPTDKPLFWVNDYGSDQAVVNGTFTVVLATTGFMHLFNQ